VKERGKGKGKGMKELTQNKTYIQNKMKGNKGK